MGEKNRHFSREFKRDAVQLVTEKGMPVGKVARELDIHPNLLHLWRRRWLFGTGFPCHRCSFTDRLRVF